MRAEIEAGSTDAVGLVSQAVSAITQHIRSEELGPGDRLPSEAHFAKTLSMSRTVVREAFQSLAAMRLIELRAGKRAIVAALDYGAMSPVIEHGVHIEQISIQQVYDVRRTIETRTAALAALRRTNAEGESILAHAQAMRRHVDTPSVVMDHDLAFHLEIAKAAKNPVFTLIVGAFEGVTRQTWPIGWRSRTSAEEQHAMIDIHLALGRAIKDGDPTAAREEMARHFDVSVQALLAAGIA